MNIALQLIAGFVRRTWLVALATVAVCAVFAAHAVAALGADEEPLPAAAKLPAAVRARVPSPHARPDGAALVTRNMFCSACGPAETGPVGATFSPANAVLIATSVGPAWSRATVRVVGSEVQGSWALGETIPGVGLVARIGATSIDVTDPAGHKARLSLLDGTKVIADGGGPGSAKPDAAAADPWADRIKKLDDHSYEVDRDLVKELVTGAANPGKGVRAMPIVVDGDVKGVRFYGVAAGSLPAAIGLKSGDTLAEINGEQIKTAQQMLDLYAKLDQLTGVELAGKRGGKPLSISLHLR